MTSRSTMYTWGPRLKWGQGKVRMPNHGAEWASTELPQAAARAGNLGVGTNGYTRCATEKRAVSSPYDKVDGPTAILAVKTAKLVVKNVGTKVAMCWVSTNQEISP
jgi:hypothetical protein